MDGSGDVTICARDSDVSIILGATTGPFILATVNLSLALEVNKVLHVVAKTVRGVHSK
jgi:hypothetical protein